LLLVITVSITIGIMLSWINSRPRHRDRGYQPPLPWLRLGMTYEELWPLVAMSGGPGSSSTAAVDLGDIVAALNPELPWEEQTSSDGRTRTFPRLAEAARPGIWLAMPDNTCLHLTMTQDRLSVIEVGQLGVGYEGVEHWNAQAKQVVTKLDLAPFRAQALAAPPIIEVGMAWPEAKFHLARTKPTPLGSGYSTSLSRADWTSDEVILWSQSLVILPGNTAVRVVAECRISQGERGYRVCKILLGETGKGYWGKEGILGRPVQRWMPLMRLDLNDVPLNSPP
jgi:hypothetical protein